MSTGTGKITPANDKDQTQTNYIFNTSLLKKPRDLTQVTRPGTVNSPRPAMLDCEVCLLEIEKESTVNNM